jgi:hypothetical protein
MTLIMAIFGMAVVWVGALGLLHPRRLSEIVSTGEIRARFRSALLTRLIAAGVLIAAAPSCHFPSVVFGFGVAALLSAAWLCIIGRKKFEWIVNWWSNRPTMTVRAASVVAIDLGLFLFYAPL